MILIYPLLIASNINPTVVPGVVKALEKYMIVYQLDSIMEDCKRLAGLTLRKVSGKLLNVSEDIAEPISDYLCKEMLLEHRVLEQTEPHATIKPGGPTGPSATSAEVGIDMRMDQKSFSLEPTWIRIERVAPAFKPSKGFMGPPTPEDDESSKVSPIRYSDVLGIKVLPVIVKSDAKLVHLLSYDFQVGKLMRMLIGLGRRIEVTYGRTMASMSSKVNRMTLGLLGRRDEPKAVSGDPYQDIIMKKTYWASRSKDIGNLDSIFVMTNLADFRQNFFDQPQKMQKLRKMGWGSVIVGDDVNKRVSFCMKPFTGMCSTLTYSMLFQSYDQYEVYKDLEEIKRSTASIFKINIKPMHKLVGVSEAMTKIDEFAADLVVKKRKASQLNEIKDLVSENVFSFVSKIAAAEPATLKILLKKAVSDPTALPEELTDNNFIMKIGKKMDPKFIQAYEFSKKVFSNTIPDIESSPDVLKAFSLLATFLTYIKGTKEKTGIVMSKLKETIMELVRLYRERKRRKLMSGEAMPEEYKAGFRTASTIILICIVFPLSFIMAASRGLFGAGWEEAGGGVSKTAIEIGKVLGHVVAEIYNFIYYIIRIVFKDMTGIEPTAIQKDETSTLIEKFLYSIQEQFGTAGVSAVSYAMALIIFVVTMFAWRKLNAQQSTSHHDKPNPQDKSFPSHVSRS
jgi:hypothetical protein